MLFRSGLPSMTPNPTDSPQAETLKAAKELIRSAQFHEAEQQLQSFLDSKPEPFWRQEASYTLAVARRYQLNFSGALDALQHLMKEKPDHSRAYQEAGYNYLGLQQPESAIQSLRQAVDLNPALLPSWKALVQLHQQSGNEEGERFAKSQAEYLESLSL